MPKLASTPTWREFWKSEPGPEATEAAPGIRKHYGCDVEPVEKGSEDQPNTKFKFIISTASKDRYNDVVSVEGWDLKNFRKTGSPVLFGHDGGSLPVGVATKVWVEDGKLMSIVDFADTKDASPFNQSVFNLVSKGVLRSASVGFNPKEFEWDQDLGGFRFDKQELLEWSIVPIPANPDAVVQMSGDRDYEAIRDWAIKMMEADPEMALVRKDKLAPAIKEAPALTAPVALDLPEDTTEAGELKSVVRDLTDLVQELRTEVDQIRSENVVRHQDEVDGVNVELVSGALEDFMQKYVPEQIVQGEVETETSQEVDPGELMKKLKDIQGHLTDSLGVVFE